MYVKKPRLRARKVRAEERTMPTRMIDPHHHLYDLERNVYPWLQLETPPELFVGDVTPVQRLRHADPRV
jgi:predicted TIM-barrel fold metal-dependent hydrolase